ncbi:MAG: cyclic nucleotide-binding domain-containing protein [Elusimicrobia bacterium]|nr:cyclic nucleotide-binding domain-containing protein [Elusimicrobiota bacterium]
MPADIVPIDEDCAALLFGALKLEGFFPELTADQARKLFPHSALHRFPAESSVVRQGEPGRDLFIIQSGEVSVTLEFGSAGAQVATMGPGEIFGEIGLMKDGVRSATVTASTESRIFRLAFADVQYLLQHNAALGRHLQSLATARLG